MMLRAEILGLVTTTATKVAAVTALVGLVLTQLAFVSFLPALARGDIGPGADALDPDLLGFDLTEAAEQLGALSPLGASMGSGSLGIVTVAVTLLGAIAATSDFRYGGIVGAVLASPGRGRVVAAKAAATGLAGLTLGGALAILGGLTLLATLVLTDMPFVADPFETAGVLLRGAVVVACLTLIGLAVGIVARNQIAGVVGVLALLVLEVTLAAISQLSAGEALGWTNLLPVALCDAAIGGGAGALPPTAALAGLLSLTAGLLAVATLVLRRRDL